jgi:hypothetical protein
MRGVKDESLVLWIPGCGGFKTTNIGAMSQFGLCIAANVGVVLCGLEEELVLLRGTLISKSRL